ncbi:hypothetical protein F383_05478 [Gossypium arboreum]|uniref:Uncharacterized protein n=8 Tax=Gossypium TaxID=3633 RepID=A0A0B0NZT5_GOSAR|nr:uncharacterized protein LOC107889718 [Gossypium hirsutum]XP_017610396.1 uncharacterized protein LOC108456307 [Gossypium arboreum]KAB2066545.1 hypothetical protein ES319_A09G168600v1 [Gossypium barbadense]TYH03061.1 hypothetical protein ES288_A09G191000v1 [Gossypium darwinii]TYI11090.1 hypothetical protein ES332_A09G187300v1 [Gossypium tomentosum]TYJ19130.1 hypothetical protein E1A91_A09G170900v1 [Gossypium mustelinum]KAG4184223.1 hypothetical protein ERO13_A09G159200v2 [Gossypium hirsutum]
MADSSSSSSSSSSYIHMVHRLIEECLVFKMSKEECMEALSKHANIKPVITSTVWNELEKENKEFFEAYTRGSHERATEIEKRQRIQRSLHAYIRDNNGNDQLHH